MNKRVERKIFDYVVPEDIYNSKMESIIRKENFLKYIYTFLGISFLVAVLFFTLWYLTKI